VIPQAVWRYGAYNFSVAILAAYLGNFHRLVAAMLLITMPAVGAAAMWRGQSKEATA